MGLPPSPTSASAPGFSNGNTVVENAGIMLDALNHMAARSYRREAEIAAALRAAALPSRSAAIRQSLLLLRDRGCISKLLALANGGLLVTVTGVPLHPADQGSLRSKSDNE